ncbi:hypothetical protein OT109_17865 [Phycisphaeraceae bacterium D3-23]
MKEPIPLICSDCGYRLKGLSHDASCPECGSPRRVFDQRHAHKRSNLRYAIVFTACGFVLFALSAPFAAFDYPDGPDFYGINTWWLLLGWLAGSVFHLVALQCYRSACIELSGTGKLVFVVMTLTLLSASTVVLMLFSSAGQDGVVNPFGRDYSTLGLAIKLSPTIPIANALMPSILAWHLHRNGTPKLARTFTLIAVGFLLTAGGVVCLFCLVWLDWKIGLDLYLSSSPSNNRLIELGLAAASLGGGLVSLAGIRACVSEYRRLNT